MFYNECPMGLTKQAKTVTTRQTAHLQAFLERTRYPERNQVGLPHITIPGSKLEPGRVRPASGLVEAERRADQTLTARSLLGPVVDSQAKSAGARHCSGVSSSRSVPVPRAAS